MGTGGLWWTNVMNLALPPHRLRADTRPDHLDPVSHTALSWSSQPEEPCCPAAHLSVGQHTAQDRTGKGWGPGGGGGTWGSRAVVICPALRCLQGYLGALLRPALAPGVQAAPAPHVLTGSPSRESRTMPPL